MPRPKAKKPTKKPSRVKKAVKVAASTGGIGLVSDVTRKLLNSKTATKAKKKAMAVAAAAKRQAKRLKEAAAESKRREADIKKVPKDKRKMGRTGVDTAASPG